MSISTQDEGPFDRLALRETLAALKHGVPDDADPLYDTWRPELSHARGPAWRTTAPVLFKARHCCSPQRLACTTKLGSPLDHPLSMSWLALGGIKRLWTMHGVLPPSAVQGCKIVVVATVTAFAIGLLASRWVRGRYEVSSQFRGATLLPTPTYSNVHLPARLPAPKPADSAVFPNSARSDSTHL